MFDAVGALVDRRRAAITDRRLERCYGTKRKNKRRRCNDSGNRGLLDGERILLDRAGEKTDRHRTAIEVAAVRRKRGRMIFAFLIAMSREFLERAMVGRVLGLAHRRLAIRDASRSRAVQTDEHRHKQSEESDF